MKLLFNHGSYNGSTELKSILGFIDADINFVKVKPDIITASKDMLKLIGKDMYARICEIYEAETIDADDEHLLYLVRYPIAVRAYTLLAPSNDIAHTTNGRKMRQDTNEKQAFEWMLDRDNEALAKRYYRALDDLLEHLEDVEAWKGTEAYKATHKLFIRTTFEFDEFFPIDSRLVLMKLGPGIRQCEQNNILPIIGQERFNNLKTSLQTVTELSDDDKQLLYLVQEACAYYSLSWAMMRLSVHIFPEGVLQAYTSDRMSTQGKLPAVKSEPEAARQAFAADAAAVLQKIEGLVSPPVVVNQCGDFTGNSITGSNFIST
jgi:hypothetical protein